MLLLKGSFAIQWNMEDKSHQLHNGRLLEPVWRLLRLHKVGSVHFPILSSATIGKVVDMGLKDPFNMGGAMAPAAVDTIIAHFQDTGVTPDDYDLIVTGDLGEVGSKAAYDLLTQKGCQIKKERFQDCGLMIFKEEQPTLAGGSGAGCSAVVLYGHLLNEMKKGKYQKILLVATGALLSPFLCSKKIVFLALHMPLQLNIFNGKERSNMLAMFFWAFVVGGLICVVGQLLFDVAKLTPGHTLSTFVVIGAILDGFGLYEPLIDFAGAGATIPITSFGNSLVHGAMQEAEQHGIIGVLTGMFEVTSSGISAAIVFAFIGALVFKPKG